MLLFKTVGSSSSSLEKKSSKTTLYKKPKQSATELQEGDQYPGSDGTSQWLIVCTKTTGQKRWKRIYPPANNTRNKKIKLDNGSNDKKTTKSTNQGIKEPNLRLNLNIPDLDNMEIETTPVLNLKPRIFQWNQESIDPKNIFALNENQMMVNE